MPAKWPDKDMFLFLNLYQQCECLWNPKFEDYRNQQQREVAIKSIVDGLQKSNLCVHSQIVRAKIKSVRTVYVRELKKILKSMKSGDQTYKSKVSWFKRADKFLRGVATPENVSSPNEDSLACQSMEEGDDKGKESESASEEDAESSSHSRTNVRELRRSTMKSKSSAPALTRNSIKSVSKVKNCVKSSDVDEFDTFSKHIASQLRLLPLDRALVCQRDMHALLMAERLREVNSPNNNPDIFITSQDWVPSSNTSVSSISNNSIH